MRTIFIPALVFALAGAFSAPAAIVAPGEDGDDDVLMRVMELDREVERTLESGSGRAGELLPPDDLLRQVEPDEGLLEIIDALGAEDFFAREQAERDLLAWRGDDVQIYSVLAENEISYEQRVRLTRVAKQRLLDAPRGAMGIEMDVAGAVQRGEVVVIRLIEGLPAREVLQVGDRITHINDQPIRGTQDLQAIVQASRPGDIISVRVRRPNDEDERDAAGFEELEFEMPLGDHAKLNQPDAVNNPRFRQLTPAERRRHEEAHEIQRRFGAAPREIIPQDDWPESLVGPGRDLEAAVHQHPAIRDLRSERERIADGRLPLTERLREEWEFRYRVLNEQLNQSDLSDEQRTYLEAVIDRFRALAGL